MPAWLLEPRAPNGRWAVLVHGRAARREECLRALPVLLRLGFTCLVVTYRNDPTAPPAPDGRYNLGLSEWRDVESALEYAAAAGASGAVLGGWSMGGAVVLQTLKQTGMADFVESVFLDAPVVDWGDVLAHHARLHHIPPPLRDLGTLVMGRRATRHLVGVHDPVDVALTNWVAWPTRSGTGSSFSTRWTTSSCPPAPRSRWPRPAPTSSRWSRGTPPGTARSGTSTRAAGSGFWRSS